MGQDIFHEDALGNTWNTTVWSGLPLHKAVYDLKTPRWVLGQMMEELAMNCG